VTEYQFTVDWFSSRAPEWREILKRFSPRRILEIGSYEGRSACFLIEECSTLEKLVCIDSWEGMVEFGRYRQQLSDVERRFDANVAAAQEHRATPIAIHKIKHRSIWALTTLLTKGEYFDFIYVDGAHEASDVLTDAIFAFYLLRVGGVLIFDDYTWRDIVSCGKDILNVPKTAVDAFTNIFWRKMTIIQHTSLYQLCLEKTSD
jgi:predicted O-methyltransferase YrrM